MTHFSNHMPTGTDMNKAVFVDRDGVITEDPPHYAHRIDQVRIIPGSGEAIRLLNEGGYLVIVVSNQSGIARGYYQERDVALFNEEMERQLSLEGAHIDAIYYCPHHPDGSIEKFREVCPCRKPQPGMLIQAAKQHQINLKASFLIGDKFSDILAGNAVNCRTIFVLTGHGKEEMHHLNGSAVPVAENLLDAVKKYAI
jgi:D-glycero-D-manno-heptose 1,7-bisphosphate phosphatase